LNDDLLNDFLLEAFPNPERKGCPDEKTLRAFAEDRLPPGDPTLQHVASCSECYAEYRHYWMDWKEAKADALGKPSAQAIDIRAASSKAVPAGQIPSSRAKVIPWSIAAGLLVVLGGGMFMAKRHYAPARPGITVASSAAPVAANVDLFNAVTTRGGGTSADEPMPLEQVSLPSAVVHLNVVLPRFSESGPYRIVVAKDRAGTTVVARGLGDAVDVNGKVTVMVTLDLRNTAPGMYFLATVRGSDNGTYYYPLKVN